MPLLANDFALAEQLAEAAGVAPERVRALGRRAALADDRSGTRRIALLGAPEAVRAVVGMLAGPDVARALAAVAAPIVIIGAEPERLNSAGEGFAMLHAPGLAGTGLIVLPHGQALSAASLEALAGLGTLDVGILASRISQPLSQPERALAASLAGIVEAVRLAFVVVRGEELSEADAAELHAYGRVKLEAEGFSGSRFLDVQIVMQPGAEGPPAGHAPWRALLAAPPPDNGTRRRLALAASFQGLIGEIEAGLAARPDTETQSIEAQPEDLERLAAQLDGSLAALGEEATRLVARGEVRDTAAARQLVKDRIGSWAAGQGLAGETLRLAERFRPGIKARLIAVTHESTGALQVEAARRALHVSPFSRHGLAFLARHSWARAVAAAAGGVLVMLVASLLLGLVYQAPFASLGALALGALAGLAIFAAPVLLGTDAEGSRESAAVARFTGWLPAAARIGAAVRGHLMGPGPAALRQALADLKSRVDGERQSP